MLQPTRHLQTETSGRFLYQYTVVRGPEKPEDSGKWRGPDSRSDSTESVCGSALFTLYVHSDGKEEGEGGGEREGGWSHTGSDEDTRVQ